MRDSQVLYQGTAKTGCGKTHSSHHKTLTPGRVPHVRPTRISCHAALDKDACAAFVKESSIECANATEFHRKSGGAYMGRIGVFLRMLSLNRRRTFDGAS